jgi:hypothetical protein
MVMMCSLVDDLHDFDPAYWMMVLWFMIVAPCMFYGMMEYAYSGRVFDHLLCLFYSHDHT